MKIFVSFVNLLNISLDKYSVFLSHVKSVFLMMAGTELEKLY